MVRFSILSAGCVLLSAFGGCASVDAPFEISSSDASSLSEDDFDSQDFDTRAMLAAQTARQAQASPAERFDRFLDDTDSVRASESAKSQPLPASPRRVWSEWPRTTWDSTSERLSDPQTQPESPRMRNESEVASAESEATAGSREPSASSAVDESVVAGEVDVVSADAFFQPELPVVEPRIESESTGILDDIAAAEPLPQSQAIANTKLAANRVESVEPLSPASEPATQNTLGGAEGQSVAAAKLRPVSTSSPESRATVPTRGVSFTTADGNEFVIETTVRWRKSPQPVLKSVSSMRDARLDSPPESRIQLTSYTVSQPDEVANPDSEIRRLSDAKCLPCGCESQSRTETPVDSVQAAGAE